VDLTLSLEQELLTQSARAFLSRAAPLDRVRSLERDGRGYEPELWQHMAGLGWLGLTLPTTHGGSAQGFLDAALLLEELGRVLAPVPFVPTVIVAAPLLVELATPAQQERWLPALAAGRLVVVLAVVEPEWRHEREDPRMTAEAEDGGYTLRGRKRLVPYAADADLLLVAVRGEAGTSLLAVERDAPGVSLAPLATFGGEPLYEIEFADVTVASPALVGAAGMAGRAIARALDRGAIASLAFAVGAAEHVLEATVEYAKTRVQFGRPIGSFQAVAHRCVDMRSDVDALRHLVYQAAWRLASRLDADLELSAAKLYGNEALRRIFLNAHQVFGAIGFSTEHELQLFTRRAKAIELSWGPVSEYRERVARSMGL
jgi:alkylation response protein AidB-like acyl-CoA dehydrogenase